MSPVKIRAGKDHFIVTPEEQRQKEEWDGLKGTLLHVPRAVLPVAEDDEFYIEDLIGLSVVTSEGEAIGKVKAVHNFGADDLIEIEPPNNRKTVLVPFTEEDVPNVNLETQTIVVATFDLWADESKQKDGET